MNQEQAKTLIIKTFENHFDKTTFVNFVGNLLKSYDRTKILDPRSGIQGITERYLDFISSWERIGRYEDEKGKKIDILIVKLKRGISLYHARSTQRNFIGEYLLGKLGTKTEKDAALVAFVSPDSEDWRFSLVKMDYRFEETCSGKIKVKEEFTPARRWSFLVGKNEKSHTAQSRFVPILENDKWKPTLEDLEQVFNVEVVTKEFFQKYRDLFIRTKTELDKIFHKNTKVKQEFENKNINTVDFAKKLLGQIVFLYFLQKKGWFGVKKGKPWGTGPKDFIRRLFNKEFGSYENFFNDILEPLFYEALRTDRSADDHYYSRFNCKIPFLNGGLFDPINNYDWVNINILLPDKLFSNTNRTEEGDIGDGILDVFDRYNFTVNEEEPLEKEVALDPELLGKIYEKLNAIRPDNFDEYMKVLKSGKKGEETKFNKEYGVYYTPREIVHYMCQQSLIYYLETELSSRISQNPKNFKDETEKFVKIADSVQEMELTALRKREKKEKGEISSSKYTFSIPKIIRENAELIDNLLSDIKVCDPAVGSGAFPIGMMHEIVKLRQLFSVYTGKKQINTYTLKRNCIENSLYGVDIDPGAVEICKLRFWLSLIVDEEDFYNIKPLPNLDYKIMQGNSLIELIFNTSSDQERNKMVKELKKAKDELFNLTSFTDKIKKRKEIESLIIKIFEYDREKEISNIQREIKYITSQQFLFSDRLREKENKKKVAELENKISEIKNLKIPGPEFHFEWHINFSEVFQEKDGFDVVIANPPYIDSERMTKSSMKELREKITNTYEYTKGNWDIYIAFFERGLKLLNNIGVLSFITQEKWLSKPYGKVFRENTLKNLRILVNAGRNVFEEVGVDAVISVFTKTFSDEVHGFRLIENKHFKFLNKVEKSKLREPYNLDFVFFPHLHILEKIDFVSTKLEDFDFFCENACATSDAYKLGRLIRELSEEERSEYLKIVNTGTIGKYYSRWGKDKMTYLGKKYLKPIVEKSEFLKKFKGIYAKKSIKVKIIIKGLNLLDAFLDEKGEFIPGKSTILITHDNNSIKELKYVLSIINSSLCSFYIKNKYPASSYNLGINFTPEMFNKFPLPLAPKDLKEPLTHFVSQILTLTQSKDYFENSQKQARVKEYEKQIDQLVYKLYGLTEDEIKIIEGETHAKN